MFSRGWWLFTTIVLVAVAICVWAALWQMDRRVQKQELNQRLVERWDAPPFDLNTEPFPTDLTELEYRRVQVTGEFDYKHQVILKNTNQGELPGVTLITPLRLDNGEAILVARGWIPINEAEPASWPQFDEQNAAPVVGLIKQSQVLPGAPMPTEPQTEWFRVDVAAIQAQLPYKLLPAFLAMLPEPGRAADTLPIRTAPPELADEMMHLNYTIQWFTFAVIFAFGYVQYLIYDERRQKRIHAEKAAESSPLDLPSLPHQI